MSALPAVRLAPELPFDLDGMIRDILESTTESDPRDIAAVVIDRIPPAAVAVVLAELLPSRVREVIREQRRAAAYTARRRSTSARPSVVLPPRDEAPTIVHAGRWQDMADITADPKRWRVCIAGRWTLLGECTADDIKVAILAYRKIAAANETVADNYCELRDAMIERGAATVAALPDDVVNGILIR